MANLSSYLSDICEYDKSKPSPMGMKSKNAVWILALYLVSLAFEITKLTMERKTI
jgi:hypothetical protein